MKIKQVRRIVVSAILDIAGEVRLHLGGNATPFVQRGRIAQENSSMLHHGSGEHELSLIHIFSRRYTRDDQLYGRALGFIVGNEVDAQWEWQNMGYTTLDQFCLLYTSRCV